MRASQHGHHGRHLALGAGARCRQGDSRYVAPASPPLAGACAHIQAGDTHVIGQWVRSGDSDYYVIPGDSHGTLSVQVSRCANLDPTAYPVIINDAAEQVGDVTQSCHHQG